MCSALIRISLVDLDCTIEPFGPLRPLSKSRLSPDTVCPHYGLSLRRHHMFLPSSILQLMLGGKWLEALDSGIGSVLAAPFWLWACIMSLMSLLVPIVCWIAMAVMTWFTIFLDTCIPGVYPPNSLSTKKRWFLWPTTFHLGHATAFINLLIVSFLMYQGLNNSVLV